MKTKTITSFEKRKPLYQHSYHCECGGQRRWIERMPEGAAEGCWQVNCWDGCGADGVLTAHKLTPEEVEEYELQQTTARQQPTVLQQLYRRMLNERDGGTLPMLRQEYYMSKASQALNMLGQANPLTVDPTKEMAAFKGIQKDVSTSGYW